MLKSKKELTLDYISRVVKSLNLYLLEKDDISLPSAQTFLKLLKENYFVWRKLPKRNPKHLLGFSFENIYLNEQKVIITILDKYFRLISSVFEKPVSITDLEKIKNELINELNKLFESEETESSILLDTTELPLADDEFENFFQEVKKQLKKVIFSWFPSPEEKLGENYKIVESFSEETISRLKVYIFQKLNVVLEDVNEVNELYEEFLNFLKTITVGSRNTIILSPEENTEEAFNEIVKELARNEDRLFGLLSRYYILETRRVCLFAAPPGKGKSQMLRNVAAYYFKESLVKNPEIDRNVIIYLSLENTKAETLLGIISNITDIPTTVLRTVFKNPRKYEWEMRFIRRLYQKLVPSHNLLEIIEFPNTGGVDANYLENEMNRIYELYLKKGYNPKIFSVVVDYLSLMSPIGSYKNEVERLGNITKDLKFLAMSSNIPVFSAVQINREGAKKMKKGDIVEEENIAESWKIVQDSDVIININLKKIPNDDNELVKYNRAGVLNIVKHRYYNEGIVQVVADFARSKYFLQEEIDSIPDRIGFTVLENLKKKFENSPEEAVEFFLEEGNSDLDVLFGVGEEERNQTDNNFESFDDGTNTEDLLFDVPEDEDLGLSPEDF